jgi:uncharacterized protein (UPF0333 family)
MPPKRSEGLRPEELLDLRQRGYDVRRRPGYGAGRKDSGAEAGGCLLLIAIILGGYFGYRHFHNKTATSATYAQQIITLGRAQQDLKNLLLFVDSQRTELHSREQILGDLRRQDSVLRPVVEADQRVVESVLAAEDRRRRTDIWFERVLSFGAGVVSSIIGTFLLEWFRNRRKGIP